MTMIDGVGDEVVQFVAVVLVVVVAALAWWSTNARPDRYRTVLVMRSRTLHPVTVSIRTRSNLMITAAPTSTSIQATTTDTASSSTTETNEENNARVIPLQEMDSIVDADMAMLDNNRLHFYRRVDSGNTPQSASESTSDESEAHEEVEPASNAQIREMDSIVSAMEADVTAGCDFFTRASESNPSTVMPTAAKKSKMAALFMFVCAVLACQTQAQYLPRLPPQLCNPPPKVCNPPPVICNPPPLPCNPPPIPCNPPPVVCNPPPVVCNPPPVICNPPPVVCNPPPVPCNPSPIICNSPPQPCSTTTQVVVDNSVSNALANALQLLIVSNLIENTMKPQCGCDPTQTVYSPTIDCLAPINPYNPYDNIITPCEIVAPCPCACDPIEVIPTVCYPEYPIPNIGCGCDGPNYGLATIVPNYGCGCDGFGPNIGCGCDNSRYLPNLLPNVGCGCGCDNCNCPRYGCDCDRYTIQNYGLPNIGCGCDGPKFGIQNIGYELLANALGVRCGCDLPLFAPQNCNCGFPNLPVGINVEPLGYVESCGCPNKCIYY